MKNNELGKWLHPGFAATSMAFLLTVIDLEYVIAASGYLRFCVVFYSLALVLNSAWAYVYYSCAAELDTNRKLRENWFTKGLDNLSYWSFIFATGSLIIYLVCRTMGW